MLLGDTLIDVTDSTSSSIPSTSEGSLGHSSPLYFVWRHRLSGVNKAVSSGAMGDSDNWFVSPWGFKFTHRGGENYRKLSAAIRRGVRRCRNRFCAASSLRRSVDSGHYVCVTSITDKTSTLAKLTYDHNIHEKERQNVDLQKNLMNTGENDNLRANYSSLELRLKAVEEQLEQERKENNFSDSDVLTKKQTWKIRPQSSNLILGRSGNTNTVVSNCSCCDAYADIAKDMSQLQDSILDFLRVERQVVSVGLLNRIIKIPDFDKLKKDD
ncbi:hypothetical protein RRG08_027867 [Elysia crispata]|uniref:Uncharacterized protein n=1 Tax=Elysia crispata TaxID=231223 RepID=A0AAE1A6Q8_9GAST|nr:hypothetical protein RRG08_027867 [Elysia crispata]